MQIMYGISNQSVDEKYLRTLFAILLATLLLFSTVGTAVPAFGFDDDDDDDVVLGYEFKAPIFGLAASDGTLLVADAGIDLSGGVLEILEGGGIVVIDDDEAELLVELPFVTDVAPSDDDDEMYAITGFGAHPDLRPPDSPFAKLFLVDDDGDLREIADLGQFEVDNNPGGEVGPEAIDSNPFDVAALDDGGVLVADAGANALLIVDEEGDIDWVANFPPEFVSTANACALVGFCAPPAIPAQAVSTSIAIGPDGAYYVGELKGFPAPTGESQIWRIEPGTLHAECGVSPACSVVADGFTSIVDLAFDEDGNLYVVELDEASWLALEIPPGSALGGTVNVCDSSFSCTEVATGLFMPIAVAIDDDDIFVAVGVLVPGLATVIKL